MNDLKIALNEHPVIKRIHELEKYIDSNLKLNEKISKLKEIQKQMVNAKEYHQQNQYKVFKKDYDELYQSILDFPFVEEYLELLEEANQMLLNITNCIEDKINKELL